MDKLNIDQKLDRAKVDPVFAIQAFICSLNLVKVQREMINAYQKYDAIICKHSRKLGMTTGNLLYSLYLLSFTQNCDISFYFYSDTQRKDYVNYFLDLYRYISGALKKSICRPSNPNNLRDYYSIEFTNNSRIRFLLIGEAARNYKIEGKIIFVEDFAYENINNAEKFLDLLYPLIHTNKIYINSTPNGYNHFAKMYVMAKMKEIKFHTIAYDFRDDELIDDRETFRYRTIELMGEDCFDMLHKGSFGK